VIDNTRDQPDTTSPINMVLDEVARKCNGTTDAVRLDLRQGDIHLAHDFDCATVRLHKTQSAAQLVALVANRHEATRRADRINTVAAQLGIYGYARDQMIWAIGTGVEGCRPLRDAAFYRDEIDLGGRSKNHETPLHWTQVEVARLVGTCPTQLGEFLDVVRRSGQAAAAATVREQLVSVGVIAK
jgi:hypothetical protein